MDFIREEPGAGEIKKKILMKYEENGHYRLYSNTQREQKDQKVLESNRSQS